MRNRVKSNKQRIFIIKEWRDRLIGNLYEMGFTITEIAKPFSMSHQNVWNIINRRKDKTHAGD